MTYWFELLGVAVFAATGCIAGGRKRMDLLGVLVVGMVTALGGGTVRDLVLDVPVVWVSNNTYLFVAGGAALVTFCWVRLLPTPAGILLTLDAFGLALFAVQGTQKGLELGTTGFIAVLMGAMTGVAGGVIRDILCNEIPYVFTARELYAIPALVGATGYVASVTYGLSAQAALWIGFVLALLLRLAAMRWKIALPVFVDAYDREDGSGGSS